jgi:hypothetical protein
MLVGVNILRAVFFVLLIAPCGVASAQRFGGSPPWGLEKPVKIKGELRRGETFAQPIGGGLSFTLKPSGEDWEIAIGPSEGDDYSDCSTPPFHGPNAKQVYTWHFRTSDGSTPGGLRQKRWINFVLRSSDHAKECRNMLLELQGKNTWTSYVSGRCWCRPLRVKLSDVSTKGQRIEALTFDAECALHGAWELWRLPATYVIPRDFTGWVMVEYRAKGQPELPRKADRFLVDIGKSASIHSSSDLRQDWRGAKFVWADGEPIPTQGRERMIRGRQVGDARMCDPFQSFFVGTGEQQRQMGPNPALKSRNSDCSKYF